MLRKRHDDPSKDQSTLLDNGDSQGKSKMRRSHNKPRSFSVLSIVFAVIVFVFLFFTIIAPVAFRWGDPIRRGLLFMNWLSLPLFRNVSNPELEFGLNCTRNLYITSPDGKVKLGVWHVLPKDRIAECNLNTVEKLPADKAFNDNQPVILYLHGNGGARGGNHRKELYKLMAYNDNLKYHIVAVDYRGYGDSTDLTPTSSGLVADAATAYDWLLTQLHGRNDRIIIWGHSLGTAVATYLVSQTDPLSQPNALVLEAPFTTVGDAVRNHPLSSLFKKHPMFEYFFVEPLVKDKDTNFETAAKIRRVHCHLMILHAVDDGIVPYPLGQQLYQIALETRPPTAPPPKMVTFDASHNYGHKGIFKDAELPKIIADFVHSSGTEMQSMSTDEDNGDSPNHNILNTMAVNLMRENDQLRRSLEVEKGKRKALETQEFLIAQAVEEAEQELDLNGCDSVVLGKVVQTVTKRLFNASCDHPLAKVILDIYCSQLRRLTSDDVSPRKVTIDYGKWDEEEEEKQREKRSVEDNEDINSRVSMSRHMKQPLEVVPEEDEYVSETDAPEIESDDESTKVEVSVSEGSVRSQVKKLVEEMIVSIEEVEEQRIENEQAQTVETIEKESQTDESNSEEVRMLVSDLEDLKNLLNKQALELIEAREKIVNLEQGYPRAISRVNDELEAWKVVVEQQKALLEKVIEDHEETQRQLNELKSNSKKEVSDVEIQCPEKLDENENLLTSLPTSPIAEIFMTGESDDDNQSCLSSSASSSSKSGKRNVTPIVERDGFSTTPQTVGTALLPQSLPSMRRQPIVSPSCGKCGKEDRHNRSSATYYDSYKRYANRTVLPAKRVGVVFLPKIDDSFSGRRKKSKEEVKSNVTELPVIIPTSFLGHNSY